MKYQTGSFPHDAARQNHQNKKSDAKNVCTPKSLSREKKQTKDRRAIFYCPK